MIDVLAFLTFGESLFVAIALAVYAAVIWMIVDILRRSDFSGLEKVLWSIAGLVFSIATLIVYFVWVRKRDYALGAPFGEVRSRRTDSNRRPPVYKAGRVCGPLRLFPCIHAVSPRSALGPNDDATEPPAARVPASASAFSSLPGSAVELAAHASEGAGRDAQRPGTSRGTHSRARRPTARAGPTGQAARCRRGGATARR